MLLALISGPVLPALLAATTSSVYIAECCIGQALILASPFLVCLILFALGKLARWRAVSVTFKVLAFVAGGIGMLLIWYAGNHPAEITRILGHFAPLLPIQPSDADWVFWSRK